MKLNPQQANAARAGLQEPVRVVAGAGTGKTHLLTERFLSLVEREGIAPDRILCLTFTRKAASHMRARIFARLRADGRAEPRADGLWLMTFHAAAMRIVLDDPLDAGVPPDTRLMADAERADLLDRVWSDVCDRDRDAIRETFGPKWEQSDDIRDAVFATLGGLTLHGVMPEELPEFLRRTREDAYRTLREHLEAKLAKGITKGRKAVERALASLEAQAAQETATAALLCAAADRYRRACEDAHLLDFNHLLLLATRACVKRPDRWRARFEAILVDECQDTNGAQFRLLEALAQPKYRNVTIVGDRKQSIYSFQGARPENLDALPGRRVDLTINYRSIGEILDLASHAVRPVAPDDPALEPADRRRAHAPRAWFCRLPDEAAEAAWIAEEIAALHDASVPYGAVMVLTRNRTRFPALAKAFEEARLPFDVVDKQAGWDREILKTAVALLRAAVDPADDVAVIRLLQEPPVALSDDALFALAGHRPRESRVVTQLRESGDPELRRRAGLLDELARAAGIMPGAEFVSHSLREWGLLDHVLATDGPGRPNFAALAALHAAAAHAFAAVPAPTLPEFVAAVRKNHVGVQAEQAIEEHAERDAVRISNVHQVKGLEFPVVFVAGLGAGRFPDTKTLTTHFGFDDHLGFVQKKGWDDELLARWRVSTSEVFPFDLRSRWLGERTEEEQRLLYVALTRAKERVYLTTSTKPVEPDRLSEPRHFVERLEEWIATGPDCARIVPPDARATPPNDAEVETIRATAADRAASQSELRDDELLRLAEAARDRILWRPAPSLAPVVTLSFTQLAAFIECPQLYAFRHQLRLPTMQADNGESDEVPAPANAYDPLELGRLLHRVLELYHAPDAGAERRMDRAIETALAETDAPNEEYRTLARPLLERYVTWDIARAPVLEREAPFVVRIPARDDTPPIRIRGAIDRIDGPAAAPAVWDYKSGRPANVGAYDLQLQLYAYAARVALGYARVARAGTIALRAEREDEAIHEFPVDAAAVERALDRVRMAGRAIAARDYTVDPDGRHAARPCASCPYFAACPPGVRRDPARAYSSSSV